MLHVLIGKDCSVIDRESTSLSKRIGLDFPYDWSNPRMDEDVLIRKVVKRRRFSDVLRVCVAFGLPRVQAVADEVEPNREGPLHEMLASIRNGFERASQGQDISV
jgi:hypothetical protein